MTQRSSDASRQPSIPQEEYDYLEAVLAFIDRQLDALGVDNERRHASDRAMKEEAWGCHLELKDGAGMADNAVLQQEMANNATVVHEQEREIRRLIHQRHRPYFGRIDLEFAPNDRDAYYIGIRELLDDDALKQYVIDWRSPVATLYYEAESGPVQYTSPAGSVQATMTRKRQIVINDSAITFVLDTDEDVHDTILRMVLSQQTGVQMKEIVSTLQREQNAIVRYNPRSSVLVQGVAGSGKTSVALHRAAYLLYRNPDLRAAEILILTPNPQFAGYISDVLPDLGEDPATMISIGQLTRSEIRDTDTALAKRAYPRATAERHAAAASLELPAALDRACQQVAATLFTPADIQTPYFTVPADLLRQLYEDNYAALAPFERFSHIIDHLADIYDDKRFGRVRGDTEIALRSMYRTQDLERLFEDVIAALPESFEILRTAQLILDDVDCALIAWVKFHFFGRRDGATIKHVILDEMQDLYPFQHQMIARMFDCPRTLMGDINQAVRFALPSDYLAGLEALYTEERSHGRSAIPLKRFELNHAFRSTYPITDFARKIVHRPEIQAFERQGEPVEVTHCRDLDALTAHHRGTLGRWRQEGFQNMAIIVRDLSEQSEVQERLSDLLDTREDLAVVDLESTKGMEFDAVLLWNVSEEAYHTPLDQTRLYVASTRALHALSVAYVGTPSPWLPG